MAGTTTLKETARAACLSGDGNDTAIADTGAAIQAFGPKSQCLTHAIGRIHRNSGSNSPPEFQMTTELRRSFINFDEIPIFTTLPPEAQRDKLDGQDQRPRDWPVTELLP